MSLKRRFAYLLLGQILTAVGVVGMVQANIGLEPWSCLHKGLSLVTPISFGGCSIVVAVVVMLLACLLKEPIGVGTIVNSVAPGILIDLIDATGLIPQATTMVGSLLLLFAGAFLLALGTYYYMSAGMGSGPRDSLMVALARVFHTLPGPCRAVTDCTALLLGWLLGAQVGLGTLLTAVGFGPLVQLTFQLFHFDPKAVKQDNLTDTFALLRGKATEEIR